MKLIIWVLWPAFAAAGVAEVAFFTLIDPQQLYLLGEPVEASPLAAYSIGFLFFWLLCTGATLMAWFMLPADVKAALHRHATEHPDLSRGSGRPDAVE